MSISNCGTKNETEISHDAFHTAIGLVNRHADKRPVEAAALVLAAAVDHLAELSPQLTANLLRAYAHHVTLSTTPRAYSPSQSGVITDQIKRSVSGLSVAADKRVASHG